MKKIIYTLVFVLFSCFAFSQWNELGGTNSLYNLFSTPISTVVIVEGVYADDLGNIYTSCYYDYPGPMPNWDTGGVAKWKGSSWQRLGKGTFTPIVTYSTNNVYAVGYNSSNMYYVAQWDGNHSWYELGGQNALGANHNILSLCVDSTGNLYAAGIFINTSGKPYVAKWNGSQWSQLGGNISGFISQPPPQGGLNPHINSICSDRQGNIYAVGSFTNSSGHFYVAKWDGNVWSELGGTNSLNSPTVAVNGIVPLACVTSDKYGNIYTAGRLLNAENKYYVAKWNGTTWTELAGTNGVGNGFGLISSLALDKYNNLYAFSSWNTINSDIIYKWNGNDWIALPNFNSDERAGSICIDTAGNLYTSVIAINGYVAKYDKAYTVGIEELANKNLEVKIYPNPANEIINVECEMLNEETEIKIIDVLGKTVIHHSTFNISNSIDVSHLSNGIYFLQLKTDKSVGVKKFVVQR